VKREKAGMNILQAKENVKREEIFGSIGNP
jgi:hypothetical protein